MTTCDQYGYDNQYTNCSKMLIIEKLPILFTVHFLNTKENLIIECMVRLA
jgi:hypothetical protein